MKTVFSRAAFNAISGLAEFLPCKLQFAVARRAADVYYVCARAKRKQALGNLRQALGRDASTALLRREARAMFRSFAMYLCEFFGRRRFGAHFMDEHVLVQGREHLDAALARGRGVIFCPAHYSNWELGAMVVAHLGYPITIVTQTHADAATNELFDRQRTSRGVTVVSSQHGAKGALKALRRNESVALMGDRLTGGPAVAVEFFGRRALLPQGPWRIALVSGAALLPTFMRRRFDGNYTLEIGAPLPVPQEGSQRERMTALAQEWTRCLEALLRADPSQWAVFTPVWEEEAEGMEHSHSHEQAGSLRHGNEDRE